MPEFPTDAWFQEFIPAINGSAEYAEAAATWEWDVAFQIEAEPDRNVPDDVWAVLELRRGSCLGGGVVDEERARRAPFVISAAYSRWKDVLLGDLDPVRGMMQGRLKLRGDLPVILRHVRAANELVHLTETVDTTFPDER